MWDPKSNKNIMLETLLAEQVPPNKKEQALVTLGLIGLNSKDDSIPNITEILSQLKAVDGSDWSADEKEKFHTQIFRVRKDMSALAKILGKDIKSCLTYYLGTFKKSNHYRLLKTVCTEERIEKTTSNIHGVDACAICGDGGSLLICDGCEGEYHMSCLRPKLVAVPEGYWECDECVDKRLLKARDYIITHSKLYEPYQGNDQKRKADDMSSNGDGEIAEDDIILRPSPAVLAAIKTFACQIDSIFSSEGPIEPAISLSS